MRNIHITLAHHLWEKHLLDGGVVIDATAGNGHDTLFLANLLKPKAKWTLYSIDIQDIAIENTKKKLENSLTAEDLKNIKLIHGSHHPLPGEIAPSSVALITYNLGYLPGGDKSITTKTNSSIESIQQGLTLLQPNGLMTITCYPGHPEGTLESTAILDFIKTFSSEQYSTFVLRSNNQTSPFLVTIQKKIDIEIKNIL